MNQRSTLSFAELEKNMAVIPGNESYAIKGETDGTVSTYDYSGGKVINYTFQGFNFAVFVDNSRTETVFPGVNITQSGTLSQSGYYFSGTIHATPGFELANLEHEYDHYLQDEQGSFTYNTQTVPFSSLDMVLSKIGLTDHDTFPTETEANTLAAEYFGPNFAIWCAPTGRFPTTAVL